MSQTPLHGVIIGGGLSGLCLAQELKKAGVSVAVFERDRTPSDRLQGYRIHVEPQGSRAQGSRALRCRCELVGDAYRLHEGVPGVTALAGR
jgi:flavin-dependent dehydrogenase